MTLQSPLRRSECANEQLHLDVILWEPHLARTQFRRRSLEQATIVQVSANGALVRARVNGEITSGTRVSIGRGADRGLVAVRRIESTSDATMSHYCVQFLWLDPPIQAFFDAAASGDTQFHFEWR
ncbi:MAG TPA: hypothetical protein VM282_19570 [Acidimicrobiales bacterium]|nr:hypothetical protein [Acidimicrobiales bacterium]